MSRTTSTQATIVSLALLCMLCGGCTTTLPPYPVRPLTGYPHRVVQGGLALAVQPLRTEAERERYFGVDLVDEGVLPVFVLAENRSSTSSFLLSPENFRLGNAKSPPSGEGGPGRDPIGLHIAAAATLSPVLIVAYSTLESKGHQINQTFELNKLRDTTLSPGETVSGFVYFPYPDEARAAKTWRVDAEAPKLGTRARQRFRIEFPFDEDE